MRKIRLLLAILFLVLPVLLGGCGDDDDGGDGGGPRPLATGTFTKTPSMVPTGWAGFIGTGPYAHWQSLYTAGSISASGRISGVSIQYQDVLATAVTCTNLTIKVGHTAVSALTGTFANNVATGRGGQTTVLANGSVTFPADAAGTWHPITFTTPFAYNGVDNLVVEFERTASCSGAVHDGAELVSLAATAWSYTPAAPAGSTGTWVQNARLTFAGGDSKIDHEPTWAWNTAPLNLTQGLRKVQMLYNASSIAGSGPITGIGLQVAQLTTSQTYTFTMRIGHTLRTDLTATWNDNFDAGAPVTVAASVPLAIPAGIPDGAFIWFPLPGSVFTYNGTDNLLIELTVEGASDTTQLGTHPTANVNRMWGDPSSPTATLLNYYTHQIALRFNGGYTEVITDGVVTSYIIPVGSSTPFVVQVLYDGTALGTGGKISSLAFRLGNDANAFDHADVNLVLGHTSLETLGTASLAANIESNRTAAFSGTISIPAGLKAGDWVTVPLTTPFTYDPTRNLIVQWDAPAFATFNWGVGNSTSAQYVGHVEGNIGDRNSDVSNASGSFVLDMQLKVDK